MDMSYVKDRMVQSTGSPLVNTAVVRSDLADPNPGNNTSTVVVSTSCSDTADLSVVKTASKDSVFPCDSLTYTITISNAGPATAENVLLTDRLPCEVRLAMFSLNNGVRWQTWQGSLSLGSIPAGSQVVVMITGSVSARANQDIVNTATVSSSTPDPNLQNNSSTVTTKVMSPCG